MAGAGRGDDKFRTTNFMIAKRLHDTACDSQSEELR